MELLDGRDARAMFEIIRKLTRERKLSEKTLSQRDVVRYRLPRKLYEVNESSTGTFLR